MDDGKTLEKLRGNRTVSLCLLKTARPQTTWMESIWFAALRFLLTSAVLNVADSALSFVDPARPRHCSFSLISRGPHLAKTPNEAICPDPRSAAVFAQPQCALACSAEHHMWQDVVMMAAKHSSAISEHYLCRSPVIWMCAGHRWHRGAEGWRQFVLFPFPHLALFFFFFFLRWKTWTAATSSEQPVQPKARGSQWSKVAAFLSTFTSNSAPLLRRQCRAKQVVFHQQSPKSFVCNSNAPQRAWAGLAACFCPSYIRTDSFNMCSLPLKVRRSRRRRRKKRSRG